jgi:hypothetical protein
MTSVYWGAIRATGADAKQPSLLAGLIFDESGERLTPSHAVKKGTRYRYYVSRSLIVGTAKDKSTGRRIPAANLETLVITKLRSFLADEGAVLNVIREENVDGAAQGPRSLVASKSRKRSNPLRQTASAPCWRRCLAESTSDPITLRSVSVDRI